MASDMRSAYRLSTMANDRVFLHCTTCNSLGPLLAKYWVHPTQFFERESYAPLDEWLSYHLLHCRPESMKRDTGGLTEDGNLWIRLTDEAGMMKADTGDNGPSTTPAP